MYGLELLRAHSETAKTILENFKTAVASGNEGEIRDLGNRAWQLSSNFEWGITLNSDCTLCMAVYVLRQILLGESTGQESYFKYLTATTEYFHYGRFDRSALGTMQLKWKAEDLQRKYKADFEKVGQ